MEHKEDCLSLEKGDKAEFSLTRYNENGPDERLSINEFGIVFTGYRDTVYQDFNFCPYCGISYRK